MTDLDASARHVIRTTVLAMNSDAGHGTVTSQLTAGDAARHAPATDGIRYARTLAAAAHRILLEYVMLARAEGHEWATIGSLLGLEGTADRNRTDLGEEAFRYVTGIDRHPTAAPLFSWQCPACGQLVCDRGPGGGCGPAEAEPGHGPGCARLAAARAAWASQDT